MTQTLATRTCSQDPGALEVLSGKELEDFRQQLGVGWKVINDLLEKTYKFDNYDESVRFANQVADLAREQNHHPDILLAYGKVTVSLTTHKAGGITQNDFILASKVEESCKEIC